MWTWNLRPNCYIEIYSCPHLVRPKSEELISRPFVGEIQFQLVLLKRIETESAVGCLVFSLALTFFVSQKFAMLKAAFQEYEKRLAPPHAPHTIGLRTMRRSPRHPHHPRKPPQVAARADPAAPPVCPLFQNTIFQLDFSQFAVIFAARSCFIFIKQFSNWISPNLQSESWGGGGVWGMRALYYTHGGGGISRWEFLEEAGRGSPMSYCGRVAFLK